MLTRKKFLIILLFLIICQYQMPNCLPKIKLKDSKITALNDKVQ